MAAAKRFDLHHPRTAIARALVALVAAVALGAATAQPCYPGNATSGTTNYDIRFSTSILNINDTNIRPKPKVPFNRYCFAVTGQAPCGAAEACCQAVSDAFRLTTASIKIDPKCIVGGLTSNITFALRNGSSAKSLVGWSVRKASKAAAASLRVSLDRKAARGLTSLEVCVNLPVAPGLCSTLEALCGGAACSANLTTTTTRLKGQPKSKKLPCCISSSINSAAAACAAGSGGPSGTCQPCPAGTAGTGVLPTEACPPCGATSYSSTPGNPQCTQCPRGQAANTERTGCVPLPTTSLRQITFTNNCPKTVWMMSAPNAGVSPLPGSPAQIATGQSFAFKIPSAGWAGRFWPKGGCDGAGANCAFGDSSPPCPPTGCQPPADTKVEFFFSDAATTGVSWYDVSLVDGYSLPMRIVPSGAQSGSCTATTCSLGLDRCPQDEAAGLGDLRVLVGGQAVACLSPCKRWNYPAPYGLGKPETQAPGIDMCCPTPPISSQQCRAGPVVTTKYVNLVRQSCPTAYSFAYDDLAGLHNCPTSTSFAVTICP